MESKLDAELHRKFLNYLATLVILSLAWEFCIGSLEK
jgi:hypothetical protein